MKTTPKVVIFILMFLTLLFIGCHARSNKNQPDNQHKPQATILADQQTNKPSLAPQSSSPPKKNTGPKVKITAYEITPNPEGGNDLEGDQNYFIPVDTENLAIGGHPLTIINIRGLEQLKNVRHLILYGINNNFSVVFEAIKILSNSVEKIVLVHCNMSDTSITESFPKLKAIVFRNCIFNSTAHFNFTSNKDLWYFYLFIDDFPSIIEERGNVTLDINPSEGLKLILIDIPYFPLIITEKLCNKLSNVDRFAILDSTFDTMKNDRNLLQKYHNIILFDSPLDIPDKDVPFEYRFDTLCDDTNFKVIGAM